MPWLLDRTRTMKRRPTRWRHSSWERVKAHPCGDREKIAALTADMVRAFMDGDLDTCWKLDRELRWFSLKESLRGTDVCLAAGDHFQRPDRASSTFHQISGGPNRQLFPWELTNGNARMCQSAAGFTFAGE